jgi:hypothetical protein
LATGMRLQWLSIRIPPPAPGLSLFVERLWPTLLTQPSSCNPPEPYKMAGFPGGETGRTCIAPMRDQPSSSLLIVLAQAGVTTPVWSPSCGNEPFSTSCGPALPFAWMNQLRSLPRRLGPSASRTQWVWMPGIELCGLLKQDTFPGHNLAYIAGTTFRHFSVGSAQPELVDALVFPLL